MNWLTFRYRNYIPELGRFFGSDPITEDFYTISNYQFAHNNPIWKIELEGLEGKATSGIDLVNKEPVTYTIEVEGKTVQYETRSVYVRDYTVSPTSTGGYSAFNNGGSYQTRLKSNDSSFNTWQGDVEYNYTVYEQGATEPITISTQSEQSTTVPGLIEEKYSPNDENKARALIDGGKYFQEIGGDGSIAGAAFGSSGLGLISFGLSGAGIITEMAGHAERDDLTTERVGKKMTTAVGFAIGGKKLQEATKDLGGLQNVILAIYEFLGGEAEREINE